MCTSTKKNAIICECGHELGTIREVPVSHFSDTCHNEVRRMIYWKKENQVYLCGTKTLIACGACGYKYTLDHYEYDEVPILEKAWPKEISDLME